MYFVLLLKQILSNCTWLWNFFVSMLTATLRGLWRHRAALSSGCRGPAGLGLWECWAHAVCQLTGRSHLGPLHSLLLGGDWDNLGVPWALLWPQADWNLDCWREGLTTLPSKHGWGLSAGWGRTCSGPSWSAPGTHLATCGHGKCLDPDVDSVGWCMMIYSTWQQMDNHLHRHTPLITYTFCVWLLHQH